MSFFKKLIGSGGQNAGGEARSPQRTTPVENRPTHFDHLKWCDARRRAGEGCIATDQVATIANLILNTREGLPWGTPKTLEVAEPTFFGGSSMFMTLHKGGEGSLDTVLSDIVSQAAVAQGQQIPIRMGMHRATTGETLGSDRAVEIFWGKSGSHWNNFYFLVQRKSGDSFVWFGKCLYELPPPVPIADAVKDEPVTTAQADHYIIRMLPPEPANSDAVVDRVLAANGYTRGTATIDFKVDDSATADAYVSGLLLNYESSGHSVDGSRSRMHNLSGGATGKLLAVFLERN